MEKNKLKANCGIPNPRDNANLLEKFIFRWLFPIIKKGFKTPLRQEDLFQAQKEDASLHLGDYITSSWARKTESSKGTKGYASALFRSFQIPFFIYGGAVFLTECVLKVIGPVLLGILIRYFNGVPGYTAKWGYIAAGGLVASNFLATILHQVYFFCMQCIGMKIRIGSCSAIYRKALRLSTTALGHTTVGQMTNLLSNDVNKFDNGVCFIHYLWVGPLQTVISTVILWYEIGPSCLAGVILLFLYVPFQSYMGKIFSRLRMSTALRTDSRVRIMNELVSAIRVIKMYAWEGPFKKIVEGARKSEIGVIMKANYYRSVNMGLFCASSKLVSFLALLAYVLLGNDLTADKVFLTTSLFNNVQLTMTLFFNFAITMGSEVLVSCRRIQTFLELEERTKSNITTGTLRPKSHLCGIKGWNMRAKWDPASKEDTLCHLSFSVKAKETLAVIGSVGSGKSSLLQAILGELPLLEGDIEISGRVSYASQEPWIFSGSIRNNILFGQEFNLQRYRQVIKVCSLKKDFDLFPEGDLTEAGDRGTTLSGGQKARISLARAIYFDADIYLLDDPLSAVDAQVGKHLFEECIKGFLKDKVTILVTHQLQFLKDTSRIMFLQNGHIQSQGTYEELKQKGVDFSGIIMETEDDQTPTSTQVEDDNEHLVTKVTLLRRASEAWNIMHGSVETIHSPLTGSRKVLAQPTDGSIMSLQEDDPFPFGGKTDVTETDFGRSEKTATGSVKCEVYLQYFIAGGGILSTFFLIVFNIFYEVFYSGNSYWLSFWTNNEQLKFKMMLDFSNESLTEEVLNQTLSSYTSEDRHNYVYIYCGITVALVIFSLLRTVLFYRICMTASKNLHNRMFSGVLHTSLIFFDSRPIGQILNRFTKDIGQVDDLLPPSMYDLITIMVSFFGIISLILYINIWIVIPTACLFSLFALFRWVYISSARDMKRLEATTRSPVFSQLSSTLQGLPTIRAFNAQHYASNQFDSQQDIHTSAWYTFLSLSRAFGACIDVVSSIFIGLVVFSFMFQANVLGGDAGLGISAALLLSGMLQWGIKQSAEVENHMTSVERILEYSRLEPEVLKGIDRVKKTVGWPDKGSLSFRNVYLYYKTNEPPSLKNITFEILPGEKVGIVGRTGAGKSSLLSCLFRLTPPQGEIHIDGVNTEFLLLEDLRRSISIIPQDPTLFTGTVRYNLDPFSDYLDEEIWIALEEVQLKEHVKEMNGSLEAQISEGGSNLSVGQRQLVCLARAILKHNKILVMDEATANVDPQTDSWIQETIRKKFIDCTVLTIAHRLHTIMDSDRVMVMEAGKLEEFDSPHKLLEDPESKFSDLVNQTGISTAFQLKKIAKESYFSRKSKKDLKNSSSTEDKLLKEDEEFYVLVDEERSDSLSKAT